MGGHYEEIPLIDRKVKENWEFSVRGVLSTFVTGMALGAIVQSLVDW